MGLIWLTDPAVSVGNADGSANDRLNNGEDVRMGRGVGEECRVMADIVPSPSVAVAMSATSDGNTAGRQSEQR